MFEDVVMHFIKFIENMPEIQQKSTPSKGFPKICKSKTPLYLFPFFKDTARWKMPSNEIQKTIENTILLRLFLRFFKRGGQLRRACRPGSRIRPLRMTAPLYSRPSAWAASRAASLLINGNRRSGKRPQQVRHCPLRRGRVCHMRDSDLTLF